MKQFSRLITRTLAISILILAVGSQVATARDPIGSQGITTESQEKAERQLAENEAKRQRQEAKRQQKLAEAKLKVCQNRQRNIRQHITNIERQATRQMEVFDRISQKVQEFATRKNLTVENQEALLKEVADAKAKVEDGLSALKADAEGFKCDGDNPKGTLAAIKADAKLIRADLKAYRTTLRHLIQGVRKANGQQNQTEDNSESDNESSDSDAGGAE